MKSSTTYSLLVQQLLVSVHYLTLFKDEVALVSQTPHLLQGPIPSDIILSDLRQIAETLGGFEKQKTIVRSIVWYDEPSFRLMDYSLDIVPTWLSDIDYVVQTCQSTQLFQLVLENPDLPHFGVLVDLYRSVRAIHMDIFGTYQSLRYHS
ncbi:hypothetical protein IYQ92_03565 [Streptococcus sp. HF-1907]|uniref:hypothetical protein n=1 Tax=Streptococcus sp. HF-1907 TaxID=2785793 RepID=UPI00189EF17E|nr:hypothetical protein [Streptococcus sp. HF-1907]MBF7094344.1 hypothetical protein [Streptococcus sp. HF-1907]